MANAFERAGHTVGRFDYRARRKKFKPWWLMRHELFGLADAFDPDIVLIQRGEKIPAALTNIFKVPVVFWSTQPLSRRRDVDKLLSKQATLSWVYLHTYTCMKVVEKEFPELLPRCSVMHNAGAIENKPGDAPRSRFAVFNRNVSDRRAKWLREVEDLVDVVDRSHGEPYFADLQTSKISVNIHFADESIDDFETGIFEALSCGCVVITEKLDPRSVADMGMQDALIQVETPAQMRTELLALQNDEPRMQELRQRGREAMVANRWDSRAAQMLEKFSSLLG